MKRKLALYALLMVAGSLEAQAPSLPVGWDYATVRLIFQNDYNVFYATRSRAIAAGNDFWTASQIAAGAMANDGLMRTDGALDEIRHRMGPEFDEILARHNVRLNPTLH
jgi:hypothetical protein